jgi:beta-xylosidase
MTPEVKEVLTKLCTEMEAQTIVMETQLDIINSMTFAGKEAEQINERKGMLNGQISVNNLTIAGLKKKLKGEEA